MAQKAAEFEASGIVFMSKSRVFTPENSLASVVRTDRGATPDDLIENAQQRVAGLAETIQAYTFERVRAILTMTEKGGALTPNQAAEIGARAMEIAELAGAAGLVSLGEVARGISAMVESVGSGNVPRQDALSLHLDALRLLDRGGGRTQGEDQVLDRLRALRSAIGVSE